jgi:hypothetical protein
LAKRLFSAILFTWRSCALRVEILQYQHYVHMCNGSSSLVDALQAAIAAVAKAAAAEFALDGFADGYANGGDVSDSSNDSDAATTTDVHLRGGGSISQGQFGGQSGSYRVGRRSAGIDLSTLSSSWRASDCMPFGGGGGGGGNAAAGSPHRGYVYGGPVRMSLEGVSTSDGRCALHASHCACHPLHALHLDQQHVNTCCCCVSLACTSSPV